MKLSFRFWAVMGAKLTRWRCELELGKQQILQEVTLISCNICDVGS